jgi:hypothetical protein
MLCVLDEVLFLNWRIFIGGMAGVARRASSLLESAEMYLSSLLTVLTVATPLRAIVKAKIAGWWMRRWRRLVASEARGGTELAG